MLLQWTDLYVKLHDLQKAVSINHLFILLLITSCPALYAEQSESGLLRDIAHLESQFHSFSSEYYADSTNYKLESFNDITEFTELLKQIKNFTADDRYIEAIQLIFHNQRLVENNLSQPKVISIIELLLEHNVFNLANHFYQIIKKNGDDFQLASINFTLAKFYAERHKPEQVIDLLKNVPAELSEENSAYALLLQGTAFQHLKLHSQAAENYQKIPQQSIYYRYAQLNLAISQIRRDWLTSAQLTIDQLIGHADSSNDEFTNRLYLVLGYALLQKNYFRTAREFFRNISQHSKYTNRALLGIALCAINQNDLQSALHTLSLLKNKNTDELSVEESYLLETYVYEKLQQPTNVIASSTAAMNHYQDQINNLQSIIARKLNFNEMKYDKISAVFKTQNISIEYGDKFPQSFLDNYREIINIEQFNRNELVAHKIEALIFNYKETFQSVIEQLIQRKISYLNSYLNQVRYGLARLYDNSEQLQ